jgi:hypothetical protein
MGRPRYAARAGTKTARRSPSKSYSQGQPLSYPPCHHPRMKIPRPRVTLEPELEGMAGDLDWRERLALATKLRRWARELTVSALTLRPEPRRGQRPTFARLPAQVLRQN